MIGITIMHGIGNRENGFEFEVFWLGSYKVRRLEG